MDTSTRRQFLSGVARTLGVVAVGGLPLGLASDPPALLTGVPRPTAKSCIFLYMSGGMSHLDTLDPKQNPAVMGPTKAIPTSVDGVLLGEHLPLLAQRMHHCALVRSLTSNQGAHEAGNYFVHTGYRQIGTMRHPALGAWTSRLGGARNPTLPTNVLIGGSSQHPGAGFLGAMHAPLPIGNPDSGLANSTRPPGVDAARAQRRLAFAEATSQQFAKHYPQAAVNAYADLYKDAIELMGSRDLAAFDFTKEPDSVRAAYGTGTFAHGCLLARRLIEHGVRFVEVDLGGWDTHIDNYERVGDQAAILDQSLSCLITDLRNRGLLDETLIVLASEFGRTPVINQNQGRDHYPKCFSALLAGGGVRGGRVHGASDDQGAAPDQLPVEVQDLSATIAHALGLDRSTIVTAPDGRPFTVADKGKPLTGLFA